MVIGIMVLGVMAAVVATSVNRSMTSSRVQLSTKEIQTENTLKRSIVNLAMLKVKNYAWEPGQAVSDLLPTNSDRFKVWYSDNYQGIPYSISVADNSDESGSQDYTADTDNKVYVRVTADYPSGTRTTQLFMSPGAAPTAGSEPPGGMPGGIGVCYGTLNFITLMSMNADSTISGFNTDPDGINGCTNSDGCPVGSGDLYGIATTSWFPVWELGTFFDLGSFNHEGDVVGTAGEWSSDADKSYGRPTEESCEKFDDIQELADNMLAANDPALTLYEQGFWAKNVNGNLTFGTESAPEVVYIKTGVLGQVVFKGTVDGYGIFVADGNVKFEQDFNWTGVVINDANALGNIMVFDSDSSVEGAIVINRPILSTEIGSFSMDLNFSSGDEAKITYSAFVVDGILSDLDPNYTPPAGATPGQAFTISSVQDI